MLKRNNNELDNSESRLTYLINQLSNNLDNNEELNKTYNRLIIERAKIRKELNKKKSKNIVTNFCEKLNKAKTQDSVKSDMAPIFPFTFCNKNRKEKRICDYFKNSSV